MDPALLENAVVGLLQRVDRAMRGSSPAMILERPERPIVLRDKQRNRRCLLVLLDLGNSRRKTSTSMSGEAEHNVPDFRRETVIANRHLRSASTATKLPSEWASTATEPTCLVVDGRLQNDFESVARKIRAFAIVEIGERFAARRPSEQ